MTDTAEPAPAQVKLRQILSSHLYYRLPNPLGQRLLFIGPPGTATTEAVVALFEGIPLVSMKYAVDHPLPPNYVWKPSVSHPTQLEAWSPNLKEGATSTSLRVVWKDCWDRWEEFTGWGLEQTNQILQGCSP